MKNNLNILIALMRLGIGGAETHVVELAKELKRRGNNVIVASKGGVYVKELEEAGIKHCTVPLQNKNPINMIKAFRFLKKIIIENDIDIVHSHARIPSFILGKLHKRMKFPFVTTAHWVFSTRYGLKYITDWGQQTVAVSEDIKKYLMDNYGIPEDHIKVTINGIDTGKFSPDAPCGDIKREFALKPEDNTIIYVSRMDEDRSLVIKQLLKILPRLDGAVPNLRLIAAGTGNDFETVSAMAKEANKECKREVCSLAGGRTDIYKIIAAGDLFVGVSRSALEAMACAVPTIVAGNEGYIGLFDESKLDTAIESNFCCRGCAPSSEELLYKDITEFFALDPKKRAQLGDYSRRIIIDRYSVGRMTDDTVEIYDRVLK